MRGDNTGGTAAGRADPHDAGARDGGRRRIVASMDTGVDDALALAYLLSSPDCDLAGVVATYGNVDAATALRNTRRVLRLFGRGDVPVLAGSDHPSWADAFIPDAGCAMFHGRDGLGDVHAAAAADTTERAEPSGGRTAGSAARAGDGPAPAHDGTVAGDRIVSVGGYPLGDPHATPARPEADAPAVGGPAGDGVAFIVDQVRAHGRDVTVLATGPLTDVAAAIDAAPDIVPSLRLVMMGGTLTQPGNCWDAVAETNVIQDPEAADRVFHSGADVTMVGLDVTHRCLLPMRVAETWRRTGTGAGRFLAGIAGFSIAANLASDPSLFAGGMPLHDPLAAAVALDPTLVTCLGLAMRAETVTGDCHGVRGRTVGDPLGLVRPGIPRVKVAVDVDAPRFLHRFEAIVTAGCARVPRPDR